MAYESAYRRFVRSQRGEDAVLFSRAGYTGIQQFSSHWAGDERSTWDAYRATLRALLNVGLCGVSFIGWDIAGFAGEIPSSELYLRAAAFSVFCPIMQYHSDYNGRKTPSQDRTPWNIQERTGDLDVIPTFRQFACLRLNLIPYILGQARESARTGLPLMRALVLEYPADVRCRAYPNEYLFGEALLVAPVTEAGKTEWPVYLPGGEWADLWSGEVVHGGREISVSVPRDRIPVYQKQGSIVALNLGESLELGSPTSGATDEIENLAFLIYPGAACEAQVSLGKGKPSLQILARGEAGAAVVTLAGLGQAVDLIVLGERPEQVRAGGSVLPYGADNSPAFWTWLAERHAARVHLPAGQGTIQVMISY